MPLGLKKLVFDTTYIISKHILVLESFIFVGGSTHFWTIAICKMQVGHFGFFGPPFPFDLQSLEDFGGGGFPDFDPKPGFFSPKKQAENHPS